VVAPVGLRGQARGPAPTQRRVAGGLPEQPPGHSAHGLVRRESARTEGPGTALVQGASRLAQPSRGSSGRVTARPGVARFGQARRGSSGRRGSSRRRAVRPGASRLVQALRVSSRRVAVRPGTSRLAQARRGRARRVAAGPGHACPGLPARRLARRRRGSSSAAAARRAARRLALRRDARRARSAAGLPRGRDAFGDSEMRVVGAAPGVASVGPARAGTGGLPLRNAASRKRNAAPRKRNDASRKRNDASQKRFAFASRRPRLLRDREPTSSRKAGSDPPELSDPSPAVRLRTGREGCLDPRPARLRGRQSRHSMAHFATCTHWVQPKSVPKRTADP
jgi:hypothetical protein